MLTEAFSLVLQLPTLRPIRVPNLPRFSTPRAERRYLVGPRIDTAIWVAGLLLSGATGGSVDTRPRR